MRLSPLLVPLVPVTAALLAACGLTGSTSGHGTTTPSAASAGSQQQADATTSTSSTPAGSQTGTGGGGASAGSGGSAGAGASSGSGAAATLPGGRVPAGFRAWSVTYVSARQAYVLGTAPCTTAPCTSVVRTLDGGRTWRGVPAPVAPLPPVGQVGPPTTVATVNDVRFANLTSGYAFGGGLWTTHDAARTWHKVSVGGTVVDLAIGGGTVYAVVESCVAGVCSAPRLLSSPVGRDVFGTVPGVTGGSVSTGGGQVVVASGAAVYVRRAGVWARRALPACLASHGPVLATASGTGLVASCGEGAAGSIYYTLYRSANGGATWTQSGTPLRLTNGHMTLTAASLTVVAGASASPDLGGSLVVSRDGGTTWVDAGVPKQAEGWRYVGARSGTALVALAQPPVSAIWVSDTAGRTWNEYRIR